ncbi:MAG TPA: hypothetical protein DCR14_09550 [Acidimicrobiaceae bacterium]|nr:hypothetical protein [Acidimicrobiaceae bacterium]
MRTEAPQPIEVVHVGRQQWRFGHHRRQPGETLTAFGLTRGSRSDVVEPARNLAQHPRRRFL